MKIFIRNWCIRSIRNSPHYNFEKRKFKKWKIFVMLIEDKYGGVPLIFSLHLPKF